MALTTDAVNNYMVADEIGADSLDIGILCTYDTVNMWSRMKPVRIASLSPNREGQWWRSDNDNCGIDYSAARTGSVVDIPSMYTEDGKNGYVYQKPLGGKNSPYRLADFKGYKHDAMPPVFGFTATGEVDNQVGSKFRCDIGMNHEDRDKNGPGQLSLEEIGLWISGQPTNLGNLYFGVVVMDGNTMVKYGTNNQKGHFNVMLPSHDLHEGTTYKLYPFLSSIYLDGTTQMVGTYLTLPNTYPTQMKVIANSVVIFIFAKYNYNEANEKISVEWYIEVTQSISSSLSFQNNRCRLRYLNSDYSTPLLKGEQEYVINDFSAPRGEAYNPIKLGRAFFTNIDPNERYKVQVTLGGGYRNETNIMQGVVPQI